MKNWWYYHKWYVACGAILLGIAVSLIRNGLGLWRKLPDFQVAYVGKTALPEDTVSALEKSLAALDGGLDFNGDGEVAVKVSQYITGGQNENPEEVYYRYASELTLIGDISDCESYFFLMDDPDSFQRDFHLLAEADGGRPAETDYGTEGKTFLWEACPLLSQMDCGSYSTTLLGKEAHGKNQDLLSKLSLGRRCFYNNKRTEHWEKCSELWDALWESQH